MAVNIVYESSIFFVSSGRLELIYKWEAYVAHRKKLWEPCLNYIFSFIKFDLKSTTVSLCFQITKEDKAFVLAPKLIRNNAFSVKKITWAYQILKGTLQRHIRIVWNVCDRAFLEQKSRYLQNNQP